MKKKVINKKALIEEKIIGSQGGNDISLYDLIMNSDIKKVTLKYSKYDSKWSHPGSTAVTLKSTGNGYEVLINEKFENGKPTYRTLHIDYCTATYLEIVLKAMRDMENSTSTFKTKLNKVK
jgi:hypothetical protein